jgi:hypothetical protein
MNPSSLELPRFDPNRDIETGLPQTEREKLLENFAAIYADTILAEHAAKRGESGARKRAIRQGQQAGKLFLRIVEGSPLEEQIEQISILNETVSNAHREHRIPPNGFVHGFMGEFASGVLVHESRLDIRYPRDKDDLQNQTDLVAFLPGGEEVSIQVKTISIPGAIDRARFQFQGFPERVPIFSPLRDQKDYQRFSGLMTENIPYTDEETLTKIQEILATAKVFQDETLDRGTIPLFCLFLTTESGSDIDRTTFRPIKAAQRQALQELNDFIETT